jgi:hypothetical protein
MENNRCMQAGKNFAMDGMEETVVADRMCHFLRL